MRITWVTRSFLDYRIPVFAALDELCGHQLTLVYNREVVPERCVKKLQEVLGERNQALSGEKRLAGEKDAPISTTKKKGVRIPFQPGLVKVVRSSSPEVIISDGFFQWTYAALWMRFRYGIPHLMCYEPTKHTERNAQWYRTLYRRMASHWIDGICCNGSLCQEYCKDILHIPAEKLSVGNMAADSEALSRQCQGIPEEESLAFRQNFSLKGLIYLFVGRLVELKGLRQFLQTLKIAELQNATFLCVGDGPLKEELQAFCEENRIHAVFMGNIDYDKIAIYYRVSDVFVIPTLQDNWSLVVPEAMSCGLPILCSCYNGCHPELVHPENGWVFDPLKIQETAEVLRGVNAKSAEELRGMGEHSRRIVSGFTPAIAAQSIFEGCQRAIDSRKR